MSPVDKYTYREDFRPFGNGSPIAYKYTTPQSGGDIAQGEFVTWDGTNRVLVRFVRDGSQGPFVGITRDSALAVKKLGNQAALGPIELAVFTTGVHLLTGSVGDTYAHGDKVYMPGSPPDTQKISKTQGTGGIQIGIVHLPQGNTLAGAVDVPVLIDNFTITQKP